MEADIKKTGLIKRKHIILVCIVMFLIWAIPFVNQEAAVIYNFNATFENCALIILGVTVGLCLALKKNNGFFATLIIFVPFMFSHPFDAYSIPKGLFVAIALVVIGLVINILRFKVKMKIGKFFWGFAFFCLTCILGGLGNFKDFYFPQLFLTSLVAIGLLLAYMFLSSTIKITYQDVAFLMCALGIFIVAQLFTFYFCHFNNLEFALKDKMTYVGWGISNNISMILLVTLPFAYYFLLSSKGWKTFIPAVVLGLHCIAIIFTYSRGGIIAMAIELIGLSFYGLIKAKDRWRFIIGELLIVIFIGGIFLVIFLCSENLFKMIFDDNLDFDLSTLVSRLNIYKSVIEMSKKNLLFGYGMFQPFYDAGGGYSWGHNTFIHTLHVSGLVGICGLLGHLTQKYYVLAKRFSLGAYVVFWGLLGSGLYGLLDVSYYFVNYMVVLIILLSIIEFPLNNRKEVG